MKTLFQTLKSKTENLTINELQNEVQNLVSEIVNTDDRLLSVSKSWSGYGTWKSVGFANKYHFGEDLTALILKGLNGTITHDEDREFKIEDFEDSLFNIIFEGI